MGVKIKRVYVGQMQVRPPVAVVDFLLVGGGGAGGKSQGKPGGGGGAGGLIYCEGVTVCGRTAVTIGGGGIGCNCSGASYYDGTQGKDSCFGSFVAYGGGGGGPMQACATGCPGFVGGSAGGSSALNSTCSSGCAGQGNSGGAGYTSGCGAGGGGGGYCCPGCNAGCIGSYKCCGGDGGEGLCSNISGEYVRYASGGGGGTCSAASCNLYGKSCGGGNGGYICCAGCPATCYGSGGGGAGAHSCYNCARAGGNGCQGVLIVRYPSNCPYKISGGDNIYECNGYCIHRFTSDGTLIVS